MEREKEVGMAGNSGRGAGMAGLTLCPPVTLCLTSTAAANEQEPSVIEAGPGRTGRPLRVRQPGQSQWQLHVESGAEQCGTLESRVRMDWFGRSTCRRWRDRGFCGCECYICRLQHRIGEDPQRAVVGDQVE